MTKMTPPNSLLLGLAISLLLVLAWPVSCSDPVIFPVARDTDTSLYTIPVRDGDNHVIDLAGPILWSTCAADYLPASFKCQDRECKLANAYRPPLGCRAAGQPCKQKHCEAYPYNPITGQCAAANLIHTRLIANTTDGRNPLSQASIRAVGACAPSKQLLARLPSGATGVAGLAGSGLAMPAQVAASHHVANKFLLCLPSLDRGGDGVIIFGGGPLFLRESPEMEVTSTLAYTPLRSRKGSPMYYLAVKGIDVGRARVPLPASALDVTGGVVLSTRTPYTSLRPDVYRPLVHAFDKAFPWKHGRAKAVAPFELCYRSLPRTRYGYAVPDITLNFVEGGGGGWTFGGSNTMVDVSDETACLAFTEMKGVKPGDRTVPSVVIGGFQMENTLLQFDLDKRQLGFANLPFFTSCSSFNFTKTH